RPLAPHRSQHVLLVLGQRGSHGGDGVLETPLLKNDGVEIPLDDHRGALLSDGGAGGVERVQGGALVKEDRPLRIDVLAALVGANGPAAESDDPAPAVLYRDDEAVPEPIEGSPIAPADEAGGDSLVVGVPLLPEVAD